MLYKIQFVRLMPWISLLHLLTFSQQGDIITKNQILRPHCFQREAAPGTGSYNFVERIGEYVKGRLKME